MMFTGDKAKFDAAGRIKPEYMTAIERMRDTVKLLNNCGEDFAQRFTEKQLVTLWLAYRASDFDIPPDRWSDFQVRQALNGQAPNFSDDGDPINRSIKRFKVPR